MSTNIYKGGGGVQKVQNLVYVENGCPPTVSNKDLDIQNEHVKASVSRTKDVNTAVFI